ncbi:MAG: SMP-30/gluconolactonase/LRE family protein [Actinomycetota bacterium]|nr:SMP-30/gluconolactonase/LRE family protein [Actinomycetota bacterium]
MVGISVDIALESRASLGEGPIWDASSEKLLWVDIPRREVHRYDPGTGLDESDVMSSQVGIAIPREKGGLLIALERELVQNDAWGGEVRTVSRPASFPPGARFNDGLCDPRGRFWVGSLTEERVPGAASLYRLGDDRELTVVLDGVTVSNGLAWSPDGRSMYYADTPTLGVDVFDYDLDTGSISNRRRLVTIGDGLGRPDGMCVDAQGGLWVCLVFGGAVHRYSPNGDLDRRVELPTTKVTSCEFGGRDLDVLYVTSGTIGLSAQELLEQPYAGSLFCLSPGVAGLPATSFSG